MPGGELLYAGIFGRGGIFALILGVFFTVAVILLLSTARSGILRNGPHASATRFLLIAAGASTLGYCGLRLGGVLFPSSSLMGGLALIFGPIYWLASLALVVATIACVVLKGRWNVPR